MATEEKQAQAQALVREIARLLDVVNKRTRVDAKKEERRKKKEEQQGKHKHLFKNKSQAQLQPSQVTQQPEQPKQLTNCFEEQTAG